MLCRARPSLRTILSIVVVVVVLVVFVAFVFCGRNTAAMLETIEKRCGQQNA